MQPLSEASTRSHGKEIMQPITQLIQLGTGVRKRKIVGSYNLNLRSYQIPQERDNATDSDWNRGAED